MCSKLCLREEDLGEVVFSVSNTIFSKYLSASLQRSTAKGVPIVSGSPTKTVPAPEVKYLFSVASQGSLDPSWKGFVFEKLLHLLFQPTYRGR